MTDTEGQRMGLFKARGFQVVAVGLLSGTLLCIGLLAFARKSHSELDLYIHAARRMSQGEAIYGLDVRAFSYPPLFALVFIPLAMLPEVLHYPVWYLVNVGVLALIFWRLNRLLRPALGHKPQQWFFWALVLALSGRHVIAPVENHSHDLLVLLCVLLAIEAWCGAKAKSTGCWAGMGAALKATPLLFAPLLLWHRKWTGLAAMGTSLAALTFLPDLFFPATSGASWTMSWSRTFLVGVAPGESATLRNTWPAWTVLNQSLAGTIHRLVTPVPAEVARKDKAAKARDNRKGWAFNMPSGRANHDAHILALSPTQRKWTVLLAQLTVLSWLAWVTRPALTRRLTEAQRSFQRLGEGAALATAMVLLSPSSIKTHFCVLLLPVAFCLADFLYRRRDPFVGAMLCVAFVLGTLTVKDLLGVELGDRVLAYGSVTACTLGLYLATGRVLLQRSRCCEQAGEDGFKPAVSNAPSRLKAA